MGIVAYVGDNTDVSLLRHRGKTLLAMPTGGGEMIVNVGKHISAIALMSTQSLPYHQMNISTIIPERFSNNKWGRGA